MGRSPEDFEAMDAFFVVIFNGLDDVSGQRLTIRRGYARSDLRVGHVFQDILGEGPNGLPQLDYSLIHETEAQEEAAIEEEQAEGAGLKQPELRQFAPQFLRHVLQAVARGGEIGRGVASARDSASPGTPDKGAARPGPRHRPIAGRSA